GGGGGRRRGGGGAGGAGGGPRGGGGGGTRPAGGGGAGGRGRGGGSPRLHPPFSSTEAAALAEAALADTLAAVRRTPARRRVVALSGRPGRWLPAGFEVVPQPAGGLDRRIAAAPARRPRAWLLGGLGTPP